MVLRSCACAATPRSEAKPSKDTTTLNFMKPPFKLVIQRKPAELLRGRTFRGVPQAGGQQSAFVLFFALVYGCGERGGSYLQLFEEIILKARISHPPLTAHPPAHRDQL